MAITIILFLFVACIVVAAHITNPFSQLSIVKQTFIVEVLHGSFKAVNRNSKLTVRQQWWWRMFYYAKIFVYVLTSRYAHSPSAKSTTVDGIIADIHAHRFRPDRLLLTSGDHFSPLFVRNLGVFYYPMLDTAIQSTDQDWQNRQIVYLQTVAYALGVFDKYPIPVTTIAAAGAYAATCVNVYAYPSDTVYSILFALSTLTGREPATAAGSVTKPRHTLATPAVAEQLLDEYRPLLQTLYAQYREHVFDEQRGLIRTNVHLSGAKDITKRTCAFYDNVIFWKTTQLAASLGVIPEDAKFLHALKQRILETFWLPDEGYFLEDVSEEGVRHRYYSSDWLIVLVTGFLSPKKQSERAYFTRSITYIQEQGIDTPLPLKYQHERRAHRQFFWVRLTMAAYGGDAIWSFWGMEYIKVLLLLYTYTKDTTYWEAADAHIAAYEHAMLRDHGFPEVYDAKGALLETFIYRSIRQTGWVIGFEQVRTLRAAIAESRQA